MSINQEYENQHWLDNWLRLKAKAEKKDFKNLASVKEKVRTIAFIQQKRKGKIIIEDYPELTQLNLSNNELEEIIIRNCPDLKLVSLAHNKLTKLTIENCPSVQEIYTHNNKLSKWEVPLEKMKKANLRTISYSNNPLSSEEKTRLDALGLPDRVIKSRVDGDAQTWLDTKYPLDIRDSIEKLDISSLMLQGKLSLAGFTNLKKLDCSDNELTDLDLSDCSNLEYLDCSNNQYVKELKKTKWKKPDGSEIIKPTVIKGGITKLNFTKNKELREINANNALIEEIKLTVLDKLHTLSLNSNKLKILDLTSLTNLQTLNCALNQLKTLDLSQNLELKSLYCYKNGIDLQEELKVKHLSKLEFLYCYDNGLDKLNCSDLKNLKVLYCQDQYGKRGFGALKRGLNIQGCDALEELDVARNRLSMLDCSNLKNLITISCKINHPLTILKLSNCSNLEFLDYSFAPKLNSLNIDGVSKLEEIYYSKGAIFPKWETISSLKKVGVYDWRVVKDKDGNDENLFFVEETDILVQQNTERIKTILANPDNYSADYLMSLDKDDLHGVSLELRKKLIKLVVEKIREKFTDEGYETGKEDLLEIPQDEPIEEEEKKSKDNPEPPKPDFEKLYYELLAKIEKREITLENKDEITNSPLTEDKKQELYNLLTEKENNSLGENKEQPINYSFWISLGVVIVIGILIGYLFSKKKKFKVLFD